MREFPDFSVLDVVAALVLMLALMRRLEVKSVNPKDYPHVALDDLTRWRRMALRVYRFAAIVCLAKVVLGQAWLALMVPVVPHLATFIFGFAVEALWIVALVASWKWASDARSVRERLGLVPQPPQPR